MTWLGREGLSQPLDVGRLWVARAESTAGLNPLARLDLVRPRLPENSPRQGQTAGHQFGRASRQLKLPVGPLGESYCRLNRQPPSRTQPGRWQSPLARPASLACLYVSGSPGLKPARQLPTRRPPPAGPARLQPACLSLAWSGLTVGKSSHSQAGALGCAGLSARPIGPGSIKTQQTGSLPRFF